METLKNLIPVATFVIAFCSLLAGLGFIFNLLLGPITASQEQLKANQERIERDLNQFKTEVNAKLDKLLDK